MNKDLDEFVQHELAQLSESARHQLAAADAMPQRLFHLADAAGVQAVVHGGILKAFDWRLGCSEPLVRYGVDLVNAFLDKRQHASMNPLRAQFRQETLANFNPRGSHFDRFVARLFECPDAGDPGSFPGYALGLAVANLPIQTSADETEASIRLLRAIYSREQQMAIVTALYQSYEDYFVSAVHRFGEQNRDELLTPCWDKFRHDIGTFLPRFRDPASLREREWIAIALIRPHQQDVPVVFEIIDNRLIPSVALDIGGPAANGGHAHPLDAIAIGASLPFELTREVLSTFLHRNEAHGVVIMPAQSLAAQPVVAQAGT